ncbi:MULTISPECIES: heat-inducible transcriptional repressor HrcA [Virgibacillus]|uniref:Heat-inducible transcription repressor HrcA n=1 Tax=Virgibacillus pantothenticus TaxID=1473 RepID=A0A0L0QPK5_VIRPA|nr:MULTISPECIES: heat-inducible transcriptional repressor HrcA [Virgibacillus]API90585.1 heat-inducible transcriptional repressor HrcA [Virgibacillus sp. 6R]KNE20540.1 HrcA family transcriptional regulator [Virgibacillus pantothenticus]MBS7429700.1 heat-inducible transcriptional repressor HrcA [Virgibacillus sp. 19R1-5]MBU8565575.1 heat-inducible transcriptional repressor HrcA [Virgibacillus pantothenticus]MBU8599873.1 heat-inducible transcriptional repressor HrcA [Virgibacillus pantothenticus
MLTERQLLILQVIIDDFIESAHPVGSRAIAKKEVIPYSAATIRNEMADLEDMGFLEKTHSSSGRIPSEKGYRYYVDHLISPSILQQEGNVIKHMIQDGFFEFEQIVQMSAEVLSELTNYTSIILGPEIFETKLKQIQIIPLSASTAVAILVTNTGHVEHRSFSIPEEINSSDLEKMVNILNDQLHGVPILQLAEKFNAEIDAMMQKYVSDLDKSYQHLKGAFLQDHPVKLYIGGKSNMLMQPEFNDVNKIRAFYTMIENEDEIVNLLKQSNDGIKVSIGRENDVDAIKDLSLITAAYHLGEGQMGTIALLGPTRMEYRKVISLLNILSHEMTDVLYMRYKDEN